VILAVAVLDRVDDRLAHGDANPVDRVLVELRELADAVAHHLDEIDHLELAVDLETDGSAACQHAASSPEWRAGVAPRRAQRTAGRARRPGVAEGCAGVAPQPASAAAAARFPARRRGAGMRRPSNAGGISPWAGRPR